MQSPRPALHGTILIAALVANAAAVYFQPDSITRLSMGLVLLGVIVWASARLGINELVSVLPRGRARKRQFDALRTHVRHLLAEIRRLNWMAVDADRGFRRREAAMEEMDRIESRLKEIIQQIRSAAGQASPERAMSSAGAGDGADRPAQSVLEDGR